MTSVELTELLNPVLELLSEDQYLIAAVRLMATVDSDVIKLVQRELSNEPAEASATQAEIRKRISTQVLNLKKLSIVQVLTDLNHIEAVVQSTWGSTLSTPAHRLIRHIQSFRNAYEVYLRDYKISDAFYLCRRARHFLVAINLMREFIAGITHALIHPVVEQTDDLASLSIRLSADTDLRTFTAKLCAIEQMYEEVCQLLGVSIEEYPLRVRKVESGSLIADLIGNAVVVGLLVKLIARVAGWVYRNYTNEGRISAFPKRIELLENLLSLRTELQERGIDASGMDEQIARASVVLSHNANRLMEGEPQITINNRTLSVGLDLKQKFLADKGRLSLPLPDEQGDKQE